MEEWKNIKDYERYAVSTFGNVRNNKTGRIMKAGNSGDGYLTFGLTSNNKTKTFKAHRLIADSFIPNDDNLTVVDHIDGNRHNNNINNLRWASNYQNMANRRTSKGENQGVYTRDHGFEACLQHNNKYIYLGSYKTIEEARQAYADAKHHYCKEFCPSHL